MRYSNQSQYLLGETSASSFGRITRSVAAPGRVTGAATASANEDELRLRDPGAALAVRALAANGFGEAAIERSGIYAALAAKPLHSAARTARARAIGDLISGATHAASAAIRRFIAEARRQREEQATYRALAGLHARTLRDIGIDRSEIRSVARELAHGQPTRMHARSAHSNQA
ncbi:MAG TPA: DUF1127 domain-containing protein [Burkholderiaceae bacterium]|nr:DUF1127 domain-containing protein [Burkholderiaceae bacterium]